LKSLVSEHHSQWDMIQLQVEFAYNDSANKSTRKIPFQIMYGMHPRGVYELRELEQNEFRSARAKYFVAKIQELHNKIKESIAEFQPGIQAQSRST
jgi:hypothetical protein